MYARIAQFELDPDKIDDMIGPIRENLERGPAGMSEEEREQMSGLEGVRRVMVFADRSSGKVANLMLTDSEEDLRRADEALNRMSPEGDVRRTSVGLFEVAIDKQM